MSSAANTLGSDGSHRCRYRRLVLIVGCGDSGGEDTPEAVPSSSVGVVPTAIPVQDAAFTPVTSSTGLYTVQMPEGWVAGRRFVGTNEETWQLWDGQRLASEIAITCEPIPTDPITGQAWDARKFLDRDRGFREFTGAVQAEEGGEIRAHGGQRAASEPPITSTLRRGFPNPTARDLPPQGRLRLDPASQGLR